MSEIKLTKRFPESRSEDITEAYMRGYEAGFNLRNLTCRNVADEWKIKTGVETSFRCSECGAHYEDCESYFAGLADADSRWIRTNYCPNCGAQVEEK